MSKIPASFAMPMVSVNGAELYHEVRGSGPPVLLIMGATGDGGHFDTLADLLADEFTVITYDRRGNGRSPAPAGWRGRGKPMILPREEDPALNLESEDGPHPVRGASRREAEVSCWLHWTHHYPSSAPKGRPISLPDGRSKRFPHSPRG